MTDQEFKQRVLNDVNFPAHPRVQNGIDEKGKPIYQFFISPDSFYLGKYQGKRALFGNFTNSAGKPMRYYFYLGDFNCDGKYQNGEQTRGNFTQLVYGTEFINMDDGIESYFANVSESQLKSDLEKSQLEFYSSIRPVIDKIFEERFGLLQKLAEEEKKFQNSERDTYPTVKEITGKNIWQIRQ